MRSRAIVGGPTLAHPASTAAAATASARFGVQWPITRDARGIADYFEAGAGAFFGAGAGAAGSSLMASASV